MFFYVYVLKSKKKLNQSYVGYTTDLKVRYKQHNSGNVKSTKLYCPWELIFYEAYKSKKDAKRREKYFKTTKGRKALKIMLKYSLD
ncbi:GIY-YIG nuclease family protein [Patescibacteria group bacterium]